jgi:PKD repeat protein
MQTFYAMRWIILFFIFFLSLYGRVEAAHIIGGELTYECLGDDPGQTGNKLYLFTMIVYRDCQGGGAQFDSAPGSFTDATVSIFEGTDFFSTIILDAPEVTFIDPNTGNPCVEVPPNVCVEEGVYTFEVSLPISNQTYTITYQRCCRNNSISNIFSPGESGATYTIELTPFAQTSCNNSPTFNNFPPPVICVNEPLSFDHSATDAEGDLLIYELCSPLLGGSIMNVAPDPDAPPPYADVNFQTPTFTAQNPLAADPPLAIDQFTGLITGEPNLQGQFVVGICVSEFRNGQLLSKVQRDFQFNVAFCEPTVTAGTDGEPVAGGNDGNEFVYRTCNETVIEMVNTSFPLDNIIGYYWEIYRSTDTLTFNTKDVTVDFEQPGIYTGFMVLNPGSLCSDTATVYVQIAPPIAVDFESDYDTCVAGPVIFQDLTDTINNFVVSRFWDFGDGEQIVDSIPIHQYKAPGSYGVQYVISDSIGCTYTATDVVDWFPAPPIIVVDPSSFTGCPPLDIFLENLSEPIDETYDIRWQFGDGDTSRLISPTHLYEDPGVYTIDLSITSPIGCTIDTTYRNLITVATPPVADFIFVDSVGITNFNNTVQFSGPLNGGHRILGLGF